jgi:hypothetical protein
MGGGGGGGWQWERGREWLLALSRQLPLSPHSTCTSLASRQSKSRCWWNQISPVIKTSSGLLSDRPQYVHVDAAFVVFDEDKLLITYFTQYKIYYSPNGQHLNQNALSSYLMSLLTLEANA